MIDKDSSSFVFLSYSRKDSEIVKRLRNDLLAHGIRTWIDAEDIEPSVPNWRLAVRKAIQDSKAILFLASPDSEASRYVIDELEIARMYNRPICSILVTGKQWTEAAPIGYGGRQHIDAREERYASALSEIVLFLKKKLLMSVSEPLAAASTNRVPHNPYKGLKPFTAADACYFFGRDTLIQKLWETLKDSLAKKRERLLAVIGASGSGKSSVVMAGLIPHLQTGKIGGSEKWIYLDAITPGDEPIQSLALVLSEKLHNSTEKILKGLEDDSVRGLHYYATQLAKPQGTKVVLIIDQFEELFKLTTPEYKRRQFIELLINAITEPDGPIILILTFRADFTDRLMQYSRLYNLIENHKCPVLPMEVDDLRKAIEGPAKLPNVRLKFEGDLVGDLLFEVRGQIGALPLLQFTLDQLYHQRSGDSLTLESYREMGGVKGALSQHAEKTYNDLPSDGHRDAARDVFVRLITPGATERDTTRRRAPYADFIRDDSVQTQQIEETLSAFIDARLLTSDNGTIEVSHEALIREWKLLTDWLNKAREDILFQQLFSQDAIEWERRGRPESLLYQDTPRRKKAEDWSTRNNPSKQEKAFLQASKNWRRRSLAVWILVLLLLISATGVTFYLTRPPAPPSPTLVTTLQDNGVIGSLRWCINNAPTGSTIRFARSITGTIELTGGRLTVAGGKRLTIVGPGANLLTISGDHIDSGIDITNGSTLYISGLSFENARNVLDNGFFYIHKGGTLTMTNSIISNNETDAVNTISLGGGIYNEGNLTVIGSKFERNFSNARNGIDSKGQGGAIANEGTLKVSASSFIDNSANGAEAFGGAISNSLGGNVTVTGSTFSGNSANSSGTPGISQGGAIGNDNDQSKLSITASTFTNNSANGIEGFGGGIANSLGSILTVSGSTFTGNLVNGSSGAGEGGGMWNEGEAKVDSSTFANNLVLGNLGSGSAVCVSNGGGQGGGIYNCGAVTVTSCTFSSNSAGGSYDYNRGGGIFNEKILVLLNSTVSNNVATGLHSGGGGIFSPGSLTVVNSTIVYNQASGNDSYGGGILSSSSSPSISFSTIYKNTAYIGGGVWFSVNSHMMISSSIIVSNNDIEGPPDISPEDTGGNIGMLKSGGYNLVEVVAGVNGLNFTTDRQVTPSDLKLERTLSNHGGLTQTLALLPGSVAIDTVPAVICKVLVNDPSGNSIIITTDQRGNPRPDGSEETCDAGAYESSY